MRNVLLFGASYRGDYLFSDTGGGHYLELGPGKCFTITGCVYDGTLYYIGANGDFPSAKEVQNAIEKMREKHPVKICTQTERLNQINYRDPPSQSYTCKHATEEVEVFVFGEGWVGQTVFVEPYVCLYLPRRDGSRPLESFELHCYQRFNTDYILAIRGNAPAEDVINSVIDKRISKHMRHKY